ncbi:MAG: STAS domain-containing protein [Clostridia bacterium]|nr:STAS domain-containing protein [Clostridia bacterium]
MAFNVECTKNEAQGNWYVKVEGEVDVYTAPKLKEKLLDPIEKEKTDLVVDMHDLVYIDSTGLGVFIGVLRRVKEYNGNIVLKGPRDNVKRLLEITGLNKIFIVEE